MKNFRKDEKGISATQGTILIIAIILIIAVIAILAVFAPKENKTAEVIEKNPSIEYFGNGILKISGSTSTELAVNLKEFKGIDNCRIDEDQPFPIATDINKSYILLSINNGCARNFK